METLTRAAILAADDLPREPVDMPEWGGRIWVRALTAGEREAWESKYLGDGVSSGATPVALIRASLAAFACCDEAGKPLFSEADVPALAAKSAAAVQRVWRVAARLNGLGAERETIEKN